METHWSERVSEVQPWAQVDGGRGVFWNVLAEGSELRFAPEGLRVCAPHSGKESMWQPGDQGQRHALPTGRGSWPPWLLSPRTPGGLCLPRHTSALGVTRVRGRPAGWRPPSHPLQQTLPY